ncbi:MAG: hypothetical protein QOI41_2129 [Myxococcales bacterium]|jgi:hypothetical protein|nr:hypothetical protein [Myxococcales bacterium]
MAGGPAPVELSADCTTCGLEAGVVELYDALVPACRFGLPATARCRLCGIRHEGAFNRAPARPMRDVPANRCPACVEELGPRTLDDRRCAKCGAVATLALVAPAAALDTELALVAALDAWTAREQWTSRQALLEATFCDPDLGSLLLRIRRNEPLEVVADPFVNVAHVTPSASPLKVATPNQDFRTGSTIPDPHSIFGSAQTDPFTAPLARQSSQPPQRISVPVPAVTVPDAASTMTSAGQQPTGTAPLHPPVRYGTGTIPLPTPPPPPSAPPRAIVYPLVSVIAADGEIHPAERALIDRFLESEGLAPLAEHEFRVHHPSAVAHLVPIERREMVVQLMCETATVDGLADESERRVIRAYAAAWEVPSEKVEFWMWGYENMSTSLVRQLWMKLRRFVLSARWTDAGQESR